MSEFKLDDKPEELIQVEQLVVEGKFEEAHELMDKFLERAESTLKDSLFCNLLKIDIMIQQGLYEDAINLANLTYNKGLEIKDKLLAFDALNLETRVLLRLSKLDEVSNKIKEEESLLKVISQELPGDHKLRESNIEFHKSWYYLLKREGNRSMEHREICLTLRKEIGNKQKLAEILIAGSWGHFAFRGDLEKALKDVELGLAFAKEINWKYFTAIGFQALGIILNFKGEIDQSIIYNEQSLNIFNKLNNKPMMATIHKAIGIGYSLVGDFNRSLEYLEQTLAINRELGNEWNIANNLIDIIINLIENHNLERVEQYIYELEQMDISSKDNYLNLWYRFCKALLLKTSLRAPNRGEAEVILRKILDEGFDDYELSVSVLLNLSELLLTEVRMLNDLEVLEELESLIGKLLDLAERSHSYHLLSEIYFLKGKMALLTLDMKEARKCLTQAQRIAERWEYNQLANKISLELDKLYYQLNMWDELKEEEISLSERIKLAGMDEQMEHLLRNRVSLTTQVKEEQITVHKERKMCIVCKGDILGFMYTCNCDALYCEKCARALIDIENVCWVCNSPIDIAKSINQYKKDEIEEIEGKKDEFIPKK